MWRFQQRGLCIVSAYAHKIPPTIFMVFSVTTYYRNCTFLIRFYFGCKLSPHFPPTRVTPTNTLKTLLVIFIYLFRTLHNSKYWVILTTINGATLILHLVSLSTQNAIFSVTLLFGITQCYKYLLCIAFFIPTMVKLVVWTL
jgi:hypothetical protein